MRVGTARAETVQVGIVPVVCQTPALSQGWDGAWCPHPIPPNDKPHCHLMWSKQTASAPAVLASHKACQDVGGGGKRAELGRVQPGVGAGGAFHCWILNPRIGLGSLTWDCSSLCCKITDRDSRSTIAGPVAGLVGRTPWLLPQILKRSEETPVATHFAIAAPTGPGQVRTELPNGNIFNKNKQLHQYQNM